MLTPDGKTSENVTLTSREQEILAAAFRALKNSAEVYRMTLIHRSRITKLTLH